MEGSRYYKCLVKCGHVGKGKYYLGKLFLEAEDKRDASAKARAKARVKHHQKDAIRSVDEISFEEYRKGNDSLEDNVYFNCKSKKEQNMFMDLISKFIFEEEVIQYGKEESKSSGKKNFWEGKRQIRKPKQFFTKYDTRRCVYE